MQTWNATINDLEMFNVVVALRIWGDKMKGQTLSIYCDNNTSVQSFFSGRARNRFMGACLRELWWIASINEYLYLLPSHIWRKE